MEYISFKIQGMICNDCAISIEKVLDTYNEIKKVNVNFVSKCGNVKFDPKKIKKENIFKIISDIGYNPIY